MAEKITQAVAPGGLGRREVLQGLAGGLAAGFAIPGLAGAHPMRQHLADHAKVAAADAKAETAGTQPEFLDAQQFETLIGLAEAIVPGSTRAKAAPFIDQLLAVDAADNQREFLRALGSLEAEAIARYGHPWLGLAEAQRVELLESASAGTPTREDRFWLGDRAQPETMPPTLRDHFDNLKQWIAGAYYSSELGMRELGWAGNAFFASFPGCEHPGGHL